MDATRDFNDKVIAGLRKQGITVIGSTWLPGPQGNYANGETGYELNDNGCSRIRTYVQVVELAGYPLIKTSA